MRQLFNGADAVYLTQKFNRRICKVMALAHELNVVSGPDHAVAVERKVVVDKELGVAAEVENVAVAVDLGDGKTGVVTQQKIVGIQAVPNVSLSNKLDNYYIHSESIYACELYPCILLFYHILWFILELVVQTLYVHGSQCNKLCLTSANA